MLDLASIDCVVEDTGGRMAVVRGRIRGLPTMMKLAAPQAEKLGCLGCVNQV